MTTINVTVGNTTKAKQLIKWLNEIKFVEKTTLQKENTKEGNARHKQTYADLISEYQILKDIIEKKAVGLSQSKKLKDFIRKIESKITSQKLYKIQTK